MTKDRENEMLKASQLYPKHQQKVFVEGVLWGDAHPSLYSVTRTREAVEREREYLIRKACDWLKRNFNMPDDFESHFSKAMEEQQ